MSRRYFLCLGLLVLLPGCFQHSKSAPAPERLRDLLSHGWAVQAEVSHPPYRVVQLLNADQDDQQGDPYILLLYFTDSSGTRLVREWAREQNYHMLSDPGFCRVTGPACDTFFFTTYRGGNSWTSENLRVYHLDGALAREMTPNNLPDNWSPKTLDDVDKDGLCELVVLDADYEDYPGFCHAAAPACNRVFRWDAGEGRFIDKSPEFRAFYDEHIRQLQDRLNSTNVNDEEVQYYDSAAISMLLDYWSSGRTEKGWTEFTKSMAFVEAMASESNLKMIKDMKADLATRLGVQLPKRPPPAPAKSQTASRPRPTKPTHRASK